MNNPPVTFLNLARAAKLNVPAEHWMLCELLQDLIDWEIDLALQPGVVAKVGRPDASTELAAMRYTVLARQYGVIRLRFPSGEAINLHYQTLRDQMDLRPA